VRPAVERPPLAARWLVGLLAGVAGLGLLYSMLVGRGDEGPETSGTEERRGYYLSDAMLTEMGADGHPRLVVRAKLIEQQLSDQSVLLTDLKLDYRAETNELWTVTSNGGRMPPDRRSLLLSGNVVVTGRDTRGAPQVHTETLAYDTATNLIQTSDVVSIRFGHNDLRGRGLRADLNTGTLQLESNINGRFQP
jgi:LPS export ABC transporter protein LptC